jgi:hypothetical protein
VGESVYNLSSLARPSLAALPRTTSSVHVEFLVSLCPSECVCVCRQFETRNVTHSDRLFVHCFRGLSSQEQMPVRLSVRCVLHKRTPFFMACRAKRKCPCLLRCDERRMEARRGCVWHVVPQQSFGSLVSRFQCNNPFMQVLDCYKKGFCWRLEADGTTPAWVTQLLTSSMKQRCS